MARLKILVEDTPNPQAMKFTVRRLLTQGQIRSFANADAAAQDELASALFALPGVTNVMYVNDFVTVNKTPRTPWRKLTPQIKQTLQAVLKHAE